MSIRKRGIEYQDERRRLDGHVAPEDLSEGQSPEGIEPTTGTAGDGRPAAPASPAGDWED